MNGGPHRSGLHGRRRGDIDVFPRLQRAIFGSYRKLVVYLRSIASTYGPAHCIERWGEAGVSQYTATGRLIEYFAPTRRSYPAISRASLRRDLNEDPDRALDPFAMRARGIVFLYLPDPTAPIPRARYASLARRHRSTCRWRHRLNQYGWGWHRPWRRRWWRWCV